LLFEACMTHLPPPATINFTNQLGDKQSVMAGQPLATALQVTVVDSLSQPIPNANVTFSTPTTGASFTFSGGNSTPHNLPLQTDQKGMATTSGLTLTANSIPSQDVMVTVKVISLQVGGKSVSVPPDTPGNEFAFNLTILPPPPPTEVITILDGDGQRGTVSAA